MCCHLEVGPGAQVPVVVATRDVVLDYVMGFLILIEGPFFKGDYVVFDGHPGFDRAAIPKGGHLVPASILHVALADGTR